MGQLLKTRRRPTCSSSCGQEERQMFQIEADWFLQFNKMAAIVGSLCTVLFLCVLLLLIRKHKSGHKQTVKKTASPVIPLSQLTTC